MCRGIIFIIGIISAILMLISLFVVSTLKEHGDTNAAIMYMIVYFLPTSVISFFNTIIYTISFERYQKGQNYKFILLLTFLLMSLLLAFDIILGIISIIGFLSSYFIWHIKIIDKK